MAEFNLPKLSRREYLINSSPGSPFEIQCPPTIIPGAKIVFIGESPGKDEVLQKKGFVGGSGNVLWRMASQAGISAEKVNRSNVAKRRPSGDNFGLFYQDPERRTKATEELTYWRSLLIAEITKTSPKIAVAVGDEALKTLCPSIRGISKWRGSILDSEVIKGLKVVPILHPSFVMRMNWEFYYIGIKDLKRAFRLSNGEVLAEKEPIFIIRPTIGQALEFINEIYSNPKSDWCIDIETRGDTISCFGLSISSIRPDTAICIPIQTTTGPYWTEGEEVAVWRALGDAFKVNPNCLNQNLNYDIDYMLDPYHIEPSGFSFDPMIAHKFLYPELDKGLDFTTSLYTYIPYYKDEGKSWKKKVPNEIEWKYNCKDVWSTPKVSKSIREELSAQGLLTTYIKRAHQFIPIALEMQRNRLKINTEWKRRLSEILDRERQKVHKELSQLTGISEENLNVKSSPQVQKILYQDLRLPEKKKRGSSQLSSEEIIIKELRAGLSPGTQPHLILSKIIEERHLRTRQSNYINVKLDSDGHWPFTVFINNDKTGRWESKSSPKWRGSKITHIPKVIRLMFQPPEGRIFVQRDLSQAEARYVGAEARCLFLNQTFEAFDKGLGPKIHKKVGKLCWGVEPKQDSAEYDCAKSIVHAYDYMEGPKRLALEAQISFLEGQRVYSTYSKEVPEIPRWHQRIKDEATRIGHLNTPTGRIRQCFSACGMVTNTGSLGDEIWRDLVSWKPQATIPDILNEGMFRTWSEIGSKVLFHQQGHDSHLDSIYPDFLEAYYEKTELFHRVPILIDREIELIIPSEMSWGYLWGCLKPYKAGDKGTYEEWLEWGESEGYFNEQEITKRLYALF